LTIPIVTLKYFPCSSMPS